MDAPHEHEWARSDDDWPGRTRRVCDTASLPIIIIIHPSPSNRPFIHIGLRGPACQGVAGGGVRYDGLTGWLAGFISASCPGTQRDGWPVH